MSLIVAFDVYGPATSDTDGPKVRVESAKNLAQEVYQHNLKHAAQNNFQDPEHFRIWKSCDGSKVLVSIRGTANLENVLTDLTFPQERVNFKTFERCDKQSASDHVCAVHSGFLQAYRNIRNELTVLLKSTLAGCNDVATLYFTGHSLGGALTSLAALDLALHRDALRLPTSVSIECHTFGAPVIGGRSFQALFDVHFASKSLRFANHLDPVPQALDVLYIAKHYPEIDMSKIVVEDFVHASKVVYLGGDLCVTNDFVKTLLSGPNAEAIQKDPSSLFDIAIKLAFPLYGFHLTGSYAAGIEMYRLGLSSWITAADGLVRSDVAQNIVAQAPGAVERIWKSMKTTPAEAPAPVAATPTATLPLPPSAAAAPAAPVAAPIDSSIIPRFWGSQGSPAQAVTATAVPVPPTTEAGLADPSLFSPGSVQSLTAALSGAGLVLDLVGHAATNYQLVKLRQNMSEIGELVQGVAASVDSVKEIAQKTHEETVLGFNVLREGLVDIKAGFSHLERDILDVKQAVVDAATRNFSIKLLGAIKTVSGNINSTYNMVSISKRQDLILTDCQLLRSCIAEAGFAVAAHHTADKSIVFKITQAVCEASLIAVSLQLHYLALFRSSPAADTSVCQAVDGVAHFLSSCQEDCVNITAHWLRTHGRDFSATEICSVSRKCSQIFSIKVQNHAVQLNPDSILSMCRGKLYSLLSSSSSSSDTVDAAATSQSTVTKAAQPSFNHTSHANFVLACGWHCDNGKSACSLLVRSAAKAPEQLHESSVEFLRPALRIFDSSGQAAVVEECIRTASPDELPGVLKLLHKCTKCEAVKLVQDDTIFVLAAKMIKMLGAAKLSSSSSKERTTASSCTLSTTAVDEERLMINVLRLLAASEHTHLFEALIITAQSVQEMGTVFSVLQKVVQKNAGLLAACSPFKHGTTITCLHTKLFHTFETSDSASATVPDDVLYALSSIMHNDDFTFLLITTASSGMHGKAAQAKQVVGIAHSCTLPPEVKTVILRSLTSTSEQTVSNAFFEFASQRLTGNEKGEKGVKAEKGEKGVKAEKAERAAELYATALKLGHSADATFEYRLGTRFMEEDLAGHAVSWYRKAGDKGSADALYQLGRCYRDGNGVPTDLEEAFKIFKRASDVGHVDAQFKLAMCYRRGYGVDPCFADAAKWCHLSADGGCAKAQWKLGEWYYNGEFAAQKGNPNEKDYKNAVKYYRLSAAQDDREAQCSLGICYARGRGVPRNSQTAAEWYQKAANQDEPEAQHLLSVYLAEGASSSRDRDEARKLLIASAKQGYMPAVIELSECYRYGLAFRDNISFEKNEAEAFSLLKKPAEEGDDDAQWRLGYYYYLGVGTYSDNEKAFEYYLLAAEQGHAEAQRSVGWCYSYGDGVPKDLREADKWFLRAKAQGATTGKIAWGARILTRSFLPSLT